MMKIAKLGASSNSNKNPYSKFGFKGTEETQKALAEIKEVREKKTLELMSPQEWQRFCALRKHINNIS